MVSGEIPCREIIFGRHDRKLLCDFAVVLRIMWMMKRLMLCLLAALLSSCATMAPPAAPGTVDHVVLFWQKKPGDAGDRQKLIDAIERLRVIEGILWLDYGTAVPSERPVVDDSFDVALSIRFKDVKALQSYEADPRHMKEVNEVLLPLTKQVKVYDFTR